MESRSDLMNMTPLPLRETKSMYITPISSTSSSSSSSSIVAASGSSIPRQGTTDNNNLPNLAYALNTPTIVKKPIPVPPGTILPSTAPSLPHQRTATATTMTPLLTGTGTSNHHSHHNNNTTTTTNHLPPTAVTNRVRVAVRCRPPFEEEGATSVIRINRPSPPSSSSSYASVHAKSLQIDVAADKCREFSFDCVFGPETGNTTVYDNIAGPIVDSVLHGVNGTVLAYGQTGSGKTYSLGILTKVTGETGIIPRSLSHIFGYIAHHEQQQQQQLSSTGVGTSNGITYSVSLSFLQLYLDAVQDLLSPLSVTTNSNNNGNSNGNNLNTSSIGHDTSFSSVNMSFMGGKNNNNNSSFTTSSNDNKNNSSNNTNNNNNNAVLWSGGLPVREDPARGFYVEGLSEYNVTTFQQAITLLNLGLENRILGSTKMNVTSSRSHTILMVRIEAKEPIVRTTTNENNEAVNTITGYRTRKSQLMLCDLAGSERVRRTSSRGARLEEARAINASLHALGQVITALSILSTQQQHHQQQQQQSTGTNGTGGMNHPKVHVPWRESKLTRLLYGNLGGTANTYLLATVGPSVRNAQESLSTLLFASRCMRVSATPVASMLQSQADYADLAARLQARLAESEAQHAVAVSSLQGRYEAALRDLQARLDASSILIANKEMEEQEMRTLKQQQNKPFVSSSSSPEPRSQLLLSPITPGQDTDDIPVRSMTENKTVLLSAMDEQLNSHTRSAYTWLCQLHTLSVDILDQNRSRIEKHRQAWSKAIDKAQEEELSANEARNAMQQNDPINFVRQLAKGIDDGVPVPSPSFPSDPSTFGPHLGFPYRNASTAIQTIHDQHGHNNIPLPSSETGTDTGSSSSSSSLLQEPVKPNVKEFTSSVPTSNNNNATGAYPVWDDLVKTNILQPYCEALVKATNENMERLNSIFMVKDTRFDELKRHLAAAEAAIRIRDEDVQNQRYVLKYLVDTTSQLREQVRLAKTSNLNTNVTVHGKDASYANELSLITDAESGEYEFSENHILSEAILDTHGNNGTSNGLLTNGNTLNNPSLAKLMNRLGDSEHSTNNNTLSSNISLSNNTAVIKHLPPRPPPLIAPVNNTANSSNSNPLPTKIPTARTIVTGSNSSNSGLVPGTVSKPPLPPPSNPISSSSAASVSSSSLPVGHYRRNSNSISVDGDEDEEDGYMDNIDNYRNMMEETDQLVSTGTIMDTKGEEEDEDAFTDDITNYNTKLNSYPSLVPSVTVTTNENIPAVTSTVIQNSNHKLKNNTTPPSRSMNPVNTAVIPTITASLLSLTPPEPSPSSNKNKTIISPKRYSLSPTSLGSSPTTTQASFTVTGGGIDTIEYIVSHRVISNQNGQPTLLYKVHWLGSSPEEDEWFPREDLLADFPDVVTNYEKQSSKTTIVTR